jgi:hypothetical protein
MDLLIFHLVNLANNRYFCMQLEVQASLSLERRWDAPASDTPKQTSLQE